MLLLDRTCFSRTLCLPSYKAVEAVHVAFGWLPPLSPPFTLPSRRSSGGGGGGVHAGSQLCSSPLSIARAPRGGAWTLSPPFALPGAVVLLPSGGVVRGSRPCRFGRRPPPSFSPSSLSRFPRSPARSIKPRRCRNSGGLFSNSFRPWWWKPRPCRFRRCRNFGAAPRALPLCASFSGGLEGRSILNIHRLAARRTYGGYSQNFGSFEERASVALTRRTH